MTGRSGSPRLGISASVAVLLAHSAGLAQVAPTEVHENAVDEFGIERTTGRPVWASGEIIGIGGEASRLSVQVTGVHTPPNATSFLPLGPSLPVTIEMPRIAISPRSVDFPRFYGEVSPGLSYVTVEYQGAYTFECSPTICTSQYLGHDYKLTPSGSGYLFVDRNRTSVMFQPDQVSINHPDGRQFIIQANGVWRNNFGYMLRFAESGSSGFVNVAAVNLAKDFCAADPTIGCATLSASRVAALPSAFASPLQIVDASGGTTKVRWQTLTARERRPLQGSPQPGDPFVPTLNARYLLGVTLPGSTAEDLSITYGPHSSSNDTHDDIRVSSVRKNGVLANYEVIAHWPFGRDIEREPYLAPGAGEQLVGVVGTGRLDPMWNQPSAGTTCQNVAPPALHPDASLQTVLTVCTSSSGGGLIGTGGGGIAAPAIPTLSAPPVPDAPELYPTVGSQIYELLIRTRIDGVLISESHALRPYSQEGMARRRLTWVRDGLGQETRYYYNELDEVAGVKLPEGNSTVNGYDGRGNITKSIINPKNGSGANLSTSYAYVAQCELSNNNWCNSPTSVTDPRGGVTNYEYNQFGQVTREMKPAPTPGAARPTIVNEYTLRTAFVKNSSGAAVAAGPPISLLTRSYTCISATTCNAFTPAADRVVTDYDYGPTTGLNNLNLRGIAVTTANDQGQIETLRTCYGYNYFGERISETMPKAGLTSCPGQE